MAGAPWSYRPLARATSSRYEPEVSAEIGADAWPVPAVELAEPDGVRLSTNTTVTTITTITAKVIQMMTGDRRDSVALSATTTVPATPTLPGTDSQVMTGYRRDSVAGGLGSR